MRNALHAALLCITTSALAASEPAKPASWRLTGDDPDSYSLTLDSTAPHSGKNSGLLRNRTSNPRAFAASIQAIRADEYRGKRVRLAATLRTDAVAGWAGLWFRADRGDGQTVAFDNMEDERRRVSGTQDWQRYSMTVDIPDSAAGLYYGTILEGAGKVWMDDFQIEIVDGSTPTTDRHHLTTTPHQPVPATAPSRPVNAGFETALP